MKLAPMIAARFASMAAAMISSALSKLRKSKMFLRSAFGKLSLRGTPPVATSSLSY